MRAIGRAPCRLGSARLLELAVRARNCARAVARHLCAAGGVGRADGSGHRIQRRACASRLVAGGNAPHGAGKPVHPIGTYLAVTAARGGRGLRASELAASTPPSRRLSGAPLERGGDLEPHAQALRGDPLMLASRLAPARGMSPVWPNAPGRWRRPNTWRDRWRDYRREARSGRVPFAVDEFWPRTESTTPICPPRRRPPASSNSSANCASERCSNLTPRRGRCRARSGPRSGTCWCLPRSGAAGCSKTQAPGERRGLQDMLLAWTTARARPSMNLGCPMKSPNNSPPSAIADRARHFDYRSRQRPGKGAGDRVRARGRQRHPVGPQQRQVRPRLR